MQPAFLMVVTTSSSEEEAVLIARSLVESHLAACVHIHPVRSIYRWEGKLVEEPEWRIEIKTPANLYSILEAHIRERHSYRNPEILAFAVQDGSADYLRWLIESTGDKARA